MVELAAVNRSVVGSNPTLGVYLFNLNIAVFKDTDEEISFFYPNKIL